MRYLNSRGVLAINSFLRLLFVNCSKIVGYLERDLSEWTLQNEVAGFISIHCSV